MTPPRARPARLALLALALLTACRSPQSETRTPQPVATPERLSAEKTVAPPLEDETTRSLRERYQGREVWVYGGGPLTCHTGHSFLNFTGSPLTPVRVVSVRRVQQRTRVPLRGGTILPQEVDTPILLRVRLPESFEVTSSGTSGRAGELLELAQSDTCQEFTELYADEAQLSRELSLSPPSAEVRAVVRRFAAMPPEYEQKRSYLGLTAVQVLWLRGAPEAPLTDVDALLEADEWTWLGPPGRGDWTLDFEDGRVVAEGEPSPSP